MNRDVGNAFAAAGAGRKCALIPYFMAFYPNKRVFRDLLVAAQDAGADMIEVGIPFSDPIADGPAIQEAGQVAHTQGATPHRIFELLEKVGGEISVPLVAMTYANMPLRLGLDEFFARARSAGVRGAVIPDVPVEECGPFKKAANRHGVELAQFVAPTTPKARLPLICEAADGFIYLVSVTGVTGARPEETFRLKDRVAAIRAATSLPVCVGFGVATGSQAAAVSRWADGVIIGSALIGVIKRNRSSAAKAVGRFLKNVRRKMDFAGGTTCE
ncbi:MAG: tryptophan synthase subunit alpha [Planctomycetota bacterium]|nr:tryptophan synthase subunit alpha [Planctomycetota bacterium]